MSKKTPEERKAVRQAWTERNRERIRAAARDWYSRNQEKRRASIKLRYYANIESERAKGRAAYATNPEKQKSRARAQHAKDPKAHAERATRWRKLNPEKYKAAKRARYRLNREKVRDAVRAYRKKNPEWVKLMKQRRRALHLDPLSPGVKRSEWAWILERFAGCCAYCGKPGTTIDHVVPLSKGGRDEAANVLPACMSCNSSKGNKDLATWLALKGYADPCVVKHADHCDSIRCGAKSGARVSRDTLQASAWRSLRLPGP